MFVEPIPGPCPHLLRKDMPGLFLDKIAEVILGVVVFIGLRDYFNPLSDFLDGTVFIVLAKIKQQRPGGNQADDVRGIAKLKQAGDEIGKTVDEMISMNRGIGRHTAVSHQAFQTRLPGTHQPGMGGAH